MFNKQSRFANIYVLGQNGNVSAKYQLTETGKLQPNTIPKNKARNLKNDLVKTLSQNANNNQQIGYFAPQNPFNFNQFIPSPGFYPPNYSPQYLPSQPSSSYNSAKSPKNNSSSNASDNYDDQNFDEYNYDDQTYNNDEFDYGYQDDEVGFCQSDSNDDFFFDFEGEDRLIY